MSKDGFKGTFRQSMSWFHTWVGLLLAVLLYFIFITGTLGYFSREISYWMEPEIPSAGKLPSVEVMAQNGLNYLHDKAPNATEYSISMPNVRSPGSLSVNARLPESNSNRGMAPANQGEQEATGRGNKPSDRGEHSAERGNKPTDRGIKPAERGMGTSDRDQNSKDRDMEASKRGTPPTERGKEPAKGEKPSAQGNKGNDRGKNNSIRDNLNPVTGKPITETRDTGGGRALYRMHFALHYVPRDVAMYTVGVATMFMFIALITGIVVHKKIFADFFMLRFKKGQRSWLDAHNMSSVLAMPFLLMITYSGLVFYTFDYMPGIQMLAMSDDADAERTMRSFTRPGRGNNGDTGNDAAANKPADMLPLPVLLEAAREQQPGIVITRLSYSNPNTQKAVLRVSSTNNGVSRGAVNFVEVNAITSESIQATPQTTTQSSPASAVFSSTMIALHEGQFASPALRWLYFISGLVGAAMVATGLILWANKRRKKVAKNTQAGAGLRFIEHSNIGIIVGLPIAVMAYFWANRLLPVDMETRAEWELHILWLVWLLCFIHASLRPLTSAWREQVALLIAAALLLPILNAITTDTHLFASVIAGDWVRASFDLSALILGISLCLIWRFLPKKTTSTSTDARQPKKPQPNAQLDKEVKV